MSEVRNAPTVQPRTVLLVGMVFAAALMRLVPHPPNFAPIAAIALFGGAHFAQKRWGVLVPLGAMFASDLLLYWGKYSSYRENWLTTSALVYLSFALIAGLGFWLRKRLTVGRTVAAALTASFLFYLATNFGSWAFFEMYPKTLSGLVACYIAGIPFFETHVGSPLLNTVLGDAFYTAVLFGALAVAEQRLPALRERPAVAR